MAVPYAVSRGVSRGVTRSVTDRLFGGAASDAALFLSLYGPYGMAMDFTDASISINDAANTLDYNSQGTISSTTGLPLGPLSKLTYSAPSAKLTEQADGYLGFQAHNLMLQSEAHGTTPWLASTTGTGVATTRTNDYAAGPFGGSATRLQMSLGGGTTSSDISGIQQLVTPPVTGGEYTRDVWIRSTDGSSSYVMQVQDVAGAATNVAITGTWTKYTVTGVSAGGISLSLRLRGGQTSGAGANSNTADVLVANDHLRRAPSVSTYVKTTSAAVYDLPYVYSSGVKTGILVEPAATNLVKGNTAASGYAGTQASPADATTTTPISSLTTMVSLTDNVNNVNHGIYGSAFNTTSATDYAISAIVKAGARNYAAIGIGVDSSNYICAVFDIANGTFGQTSVGGTSGTIAGSGTAYGIEPLANGCYRIWIAGKVTGAGTPIVFSANAATGNTFGTLGGPTYVGNGTVAIYMTAVQAETGTVATSPIITYGAAVTRVADNSLKVAVANFPVGGTAHTLYMELQRPEKDVTATFMTLQGTSTDFIQLIDDSASLRGVVRTVADGVTATLALATENALNTPFKIAISADTTADGVHDGGSVVSDAACICATTFATLDFGHASLTRPMLVKAIAYLPARKSGAELQGMTTP